MEVLRPFQLLMISIGLALPLALMALAMGGSTRTARPLGRAITLIGFFGAAALLELTFLPLMRLVGGSWRQLAFTFTAPLLVIVYGVIAATRMMKQVAYFKANAKLSPITRKRYVSDPSGEGGGGLIYTYLDGLEGAAYDLMAGNAQHVLYLPEDPTVHRLYLEGVPKATRDSARRTTMLALVVVFVATALMTGGLLLRLPLLPVVAGGTALLVLGYPAALILSMRLSPPPPPALSSMLSPANQVRATREALAALIGAAWTEPGERVIMLEATGSRPVQILGPVTEWDGYLLDVSTYRMRKENAAALRDRLDALGLDPVTSSDNKRSWNARLPLDPQSAAKDLMRVLIEGLELREGAALSTTIYSA